jgi:hypothetical protein
LMNASANPVLQNQKRSSVVAGNPDKPFSNAKQVRLPDEEMNRDLKNLGLKIENKFAAPTKGKTHMEAEFEIADEVVEAFDKHREAMQLTETDSYLGQDIVEEFEENTRLLTEADYKGKTPKYVAENFSQHQIEETLKSLGIDFDPAMSVKQKAAHLVKSVK